VTDANQILVSGAGVKLSPLNKPASLLIDSRGAEMSDCKVSVISTSGQDIHVNLEVIEGGKFKADFLPYEVGECGLKWIICKHIRIMILF
jgi:filamin